MTKPGATGYTLRAPEGTVAGQVKKSYPVTVPSGASSVYPVATGFVVAGPSTALYR